MYDGSGGERLFMLVLSFEIVLRLIKKT